jgi:hypothetical protein
MRLRLANMTMSVLVAILAILTILQLPGAFSALRRNCVWDKARVHRCHSGRHIRLRVCFLLHDMLFRASDPTGIAYDRGEHGLPLQSEGPRIILYIVRGELDALHCVLVLETALAHLASIVTHAQRWNAMLRSSTPHLRVS